MTRVGQILVILLTCFSILFMGFAVTVFSTRTNWRENYTKKKDELAKATAEIQKLDGQRKTLAQFVTDQAEDHRKDRLVSEQAIKDQQKNYADLNENYKQARGDAVKYAEQAKLYGDQAKIRSDEARLLSTQLDDARKKKDDAQKVQFETQQKFIDLTGNHETLVARLKELQLRESDLVAILEKHGMSTDPKSYGKLAQTPPEVEGIVLEVDKEGKFVKISIGSDDGLRKQHRLQIYRVKPLGKFVATIEITEVDPDQAVGRILPQFKQGNIQEGDLVATRITASR